MISTAAELSESLARAIGGETLELAPGHYGALSIRKRFASPVTIRGGTFASIVLLLSANVAIEDYAVAFVPDEQTLAWSQAVRIVECEGVALRRGRIEGGPAVNGVPQDTAVGGLDKTGNVLGLPAGRGINVDRSSGIEIVGNEISLFHKGITLGKCRGVLILANDIHHLRTTPISGGDLSDLTIERNRSHSSTPWALGGRGDHGDMIHIWTTADQTEPSRNIVIRDNLGEQGEGAALLGYYLEAKGRPFGFEGVSIDHNVIVNDDGQGIRVESLDNFSIGGNHLFPRTLADPKKAPRIGLNMACRNGEVASNLAASIDAGKAFGATAEQLETIELDEFDVRPEDLATICFVDNVLRVPAIEEAAAAVADWEAQFRGGVAEPAPEPDPAPPVSDRLDRLMKAREEANAVVNAARRSLYQIDALIGEAG